MYTDDWQKIKNSFLHDLKTILDNVNRGDELIKFSVNFKGCRIASCLRKPVEFLKKRCDPAWLAIVMYDPEADFDQVHSCHLNFYVNDDLERIFSEEMNHMFLMTGLPCGLQQYLPGQNTTDIPLWPPLVLQYGNMDLEDDVKAEFKSWVQLFVRKSANGTTCKAEPRKSGCDSCTDYFCEIVAPAAFEDYIRNISESKNKLARTAYCFSNRYPSSSYTGRRDRCLTLFIPGVYIPGQPYYMNGLLISFSDAIRLDTLGLLKEWTEDICWSLASAIFIKTHVFSGPWKARDVGAELRKYLDSFKFKHIEKGTTLGRIITFQSDNYGIDSYPSQLVSHILHDGDFIYEEEETYRSKIASKDKSQILDQYANIICQNYPQWCKYFSDIGGGERACHAAALCFAIQGDQKKNQLYLVSLLAHAQQVGHTINYLECQKERLFKDNFIVKKLFIWKLKHICAPFILDCLFCSRILKGVQHYLIRSSDNTGQPTFVWALDAVIEEKSGKLNKEIHLDHYTTNTPDELKHNHQLTSTIIAAEALGGQAHLLPAWSPAKCWGVATGDLITYASGSSDIKGIISRITSPGDFTEGTYVLMGQKTSRLIIAKKFVVS